MKVVILAGGFGTRLSEYTKIIPKPMVKIGKDPILVHIMKHYVKFGLKDFVIALGYKGDVIKKYFKKNKYPWKITLVNTGLRTMTGGRIKRLKKYINDDTFLLTYGDGISNINLNKLIQFHKKKRKLITLTAVRPPARFGFIKLKHYYVNYFKEKSQVDEGWINGGFFVIEPQFLKYISNDDTYLEKSPLEKVTRNKQLVAYKHFGFWQCMDTVRDKTILEKALKDKKF